MQKAKLVDNATAGLKFQDSSTSSALDGTILRAIFQNDNFDNLFTMVENAGYDLIDDDLSQITKAVRGLYNATFIYNTSTIVTQTVNDIVLGSDGHYYEVQDDGISGDNPVGSVTGKWSRIDGSGSGLNADLLDNLHATSFLRSDAVSVKSAGDTTYNDSVELNFGTDKDVELFHTGASLYMNINIGDWFIRDGLDSDALRFTFFRGTGKFRANHFESIVSTGTAPLAVASTTKVDNLNADLLDGEHLSTTSATGVLADTGRVKGTNGYLKLSNGITLQWGTVDDAVSVVTFPIAFDTACLNVQFSLKDVTSSSSWAPVFMSTTTWTTASFTKSTAATTIGGSRPWFAIGH